MHKEAGIVHRDIKPQNILLCEGEPFTVKLCDFGVSEEFQGDNDIMAKTAGTYHFFAPECCDPEIEEYSGKAVDIWALGVTMYCLLFNVLPFFDYENQENEYSILEIIYKTDVQLPEQTVRNIDNE